ncbi:MULTISPECIES: ROK family protein [unclassified Clostridium]|uniref:ROK family protein n=1 Tax=unclassified Clostridium TaxID=2614128 RepID=UPI0011061403|nr:MULTISPECIES: ROK family protein [unclassified Clostridium]
MRLGALEAGGTKMVCSLGNENGDVLERESFPTTTPEETMPLLIGFFKDKGIEALGIGTFGPVDLKKESPSYGYITTTPKLAWQNHPLLPQLQDALGVPCEIDTDVNAAALAEYTWGAAKGLGSCLYVTVGTGIGGGLVIENNLVHGLLHPEFGHMLMRPIPEDIMPEGICPFHTGCLEGLACGPAIEKRWGVSAKELPRDHIAWSIEAGYLAQMCANAVVCLSPEKIILGGGVMAQEHLFPMIRKETGRLLGNYVQHEAVLQGMDGYIVPPGLGINSGVAGALLLARRAVAG